MSYTITTRSLFGQPLLSYSGIASGLNTGAIVDAQTAAASQNQSLLTASAAIEAAKAGLYANIGNQLDTLNQDVSGITNAGVFAPSSVTSSNSAAVSVTGTTTAQTGDHQVTVSQLAQGQINSSANFTSANSTVLSTGVGLTTSGSVKIAVGSGPTSTFALSTTTTLSQLAQSINSSGLAVQATVVNDANGYHINLASTGTGTSSALTITESNSKTAFNSKLVQSAQDTQGTIDGAAFDIQTTTSNSLIAGVTMSFAQLTGSPVTVSVFKDATNLNNVVQTFVLNYNASVSAINSATTFGQNTNLGNLLSDSSVQNVSGDLGKIVQQAPSGATGTYHTLAEIGISQNNDGTLTIDSNALSNAIATDASSVANLLSDTSSGAGIASQLTALTSTYGGPAGVFNQMSLAQTSIGAQDAQTSSDMQYAIDAQAQTMQSNFVQYEVNMSNLAMQNQLVESFANSINSSNAAQNTTPADAAAPVGPSDGASSIPVPTGPNGYEPTPGQPTDYPEATAGQSNGYVPGLNNTTV